MSQVISVNEAASNLPELIKRASGGETVLIRNEGQAIVSLNAVPRRKNRGRQIDFLDGKNLYIADDFDDQLPDDLLAGFGYK